MRLFGRKMRKDTRGFSLVELICAVAILGAISTAIGGAMVTSANSYQRGTTEASVQQDSHFTANVIEGLLIDATQNVDFDAATNVLTIDNVDFLHTIGLVGDQLIYSCVDKTTGAVVDGGSVLAEDVSSFTVDTSQFNESRNAQITIGVARDNSEISTVYNVTARNNPRSSSALATPQFADINALNVVTLEPNQSYTTNVGVTTHGGASTAFTAYVVDAVDPATDVSWTADTVTISLGANETGGSDGKFTVVLESSTGTDHYITVNVRRVTAVNIAITSAGNGLEQNEEYVFTADVLGTNLAQVSGADYDTDYKSPYNVTWDFSVPGEDWHNYIQVVDKVEDARNPYVKVKITQKINSSLTVYAYAKHDDGTIAGVQTNKSGVYYDDKWGQRTINPTNFWMNSNFKRGDDFCQIYERNGMWGAVQSQYGGNWVHRWYRACPATLDADGNVIALTGTWSDWTYFSTGDTPGFSAFRPKHLGADLLPNESYAIEVKYGYGTSGESGAVYWPVADTPQSEYMFRFSVPASAIGFQSVWVNGANVNFPVGSVGIPESENLVLNRENLYTFNIKTVAGHLNKYFGSNNAMYPKIQRWSGSNYVDMKKPDGTYDIAEWGWMGGDDGGQVQMKLKTPATPGKYRVMLDWNEAWYDTNYGGFDQYYDEATGKGIIYFEVVG